MDSFTLSTPVVLLVFNRPAETERVFAAIREARPSRLLIVADGPRTGSADDGVRCAEVRRLLEQIDWTCEVQHNYSDDNLGCRQRVSTGINWVFDLVEEAIILEDDCLPDNSFFRFCQELLEYYRYDKRIGMISGDNFQFGARHNDDSYYFSRYFHVWGWATWRDRWAGSYDVAMKQWPAVHGETWLHDILNDKRELATWKRNFKKAYCGKIDTWDYQWVFANWLHGRLCILPAVNLISNIGFNSNATHSKVRNNLTDLDRYSVTFPLKHSREVIRNVEADESSQHNNYNVSLLKFLCDNMKRWVK